MFLVLIAGTLFCALTPIGDLLWPKPPTEMTVVKLSYQLKLTNHTILYKVIECQIKVGPHCKSDQLQGERRKLTARY